MPIDTGIYRDVALGLACRRKAFVENGKYSIIQRHSQIQSLVSGLVDHLNQSANVYEAAEKNLWNSGYVSTYIQNGSVQTSHYENWNAIAHLMKQDKKTTLSASASWAYKEAGATFRMRYASATARAKIGDFQVKGSCEIGLWKDKEWDPRLEVSAKAQASLLSAQVSGRVGTNNVYATASAKGSAGTIYAEATCVLNQNEQTLEAGVGAAALRGEASLAFNFFGARITLTAEGSIGSAEAKLSYHHKNREWEFGTKLGFIAGLGFKINVSY